MARPEGFEPSAIRLEGGCSIQLSYGRVNAQYTSPAAQAEPASGKTAKTGVADGSRTRHLRSHNPVLYLMSYGHHRWDAEILWPTPGSVGKVGRGREIRTPDILLPKQARYQTALYPDTDTRPLTDPDFRRRIVPTELPSVNDNIVILQRFPKRGLPSPGNRVGQ